MGALLASPVVILLFVRDIEKTISTDGGRGATIGKSKKVLLVLHDSTTPCMPGPTGM
jgi:hypothetical protein